MIFEKLNLAYLFICYAFFGILLSSHINLYKKNLCMHGTYFLLIQYVYTDLVLLNNSSDGLQKCLLFLFFFLWKPSNSVLKFYTITVFNLIRQLAPKIYYSISKKIQVVSRLCFRNLSWQKIQRKCLLWLEIPFNYFESFN